MLFSLSVVAVLSLGAVTAQENCRFDDKRIDNVFKRASFDDLQTVRQLPTNTCASTTGLDHRQSCSACVHLMEYHILKQSIGNSAYDDAACVCKSRPPRYEPYYPEDPTLRESVWSSDMSYTQGCESTHQLLGSAGYLDAAGAIGRAVHTSDPTSLTYQSLRTEFPSVAKGFCLAKSVAGMEATYPALMACMRAQCCTEEDKIRSLFVATSCDLTAPLLSASKGSAAKADAMKASLEAVSALKALRTEAAEGGITASEREGMALKLFETLEVIKAAEVADKSTVVDFVLQSALNLAPAVGTAKVGGVDSRMAAKLGQGGLGVGRMIADFLSDPALPKYDENGVKIEETEDVIPGSAATVETANTSPHKFILHGQDHRVYYSYVDASLRDGQTNQAKASVYVPAEKPIWPMKDHELLMYHTNHLGVLAAANARTALKSDRALDAFFPWPSVRRAGQMSRQISLRRAHELEKMRAGPSHPFLTYRITDELDWLHGARVSAVETALTHLAETDSLRASVLRAKWQTDSLTEEEYRELQLAPEAYLYRLETVDGAYVDHENGGVVVAPFVSIHSLLAGRDDPELELFKAMPKGKQQGEIVDDDGDILVHAFTPLDAHNPRAVKASSNTQAKKETLALLKRKKISHPSRLERIIDGVTKASLERERKYPLIDKKTGAAGHTFVFAFAEEKTDPQDKSVSVLVPEQHKINDTDSLHPSNDSPKGYPKNEVIPATDKDGKTTTTTLAPIPPVTALQITSQVSNHQSLGSLSEAVGAIWGVVVSEWEEVTSLMDEHQIAKLDLSTLKPHTRVALQAALDEKAAFMKANPKGRFDFNSAVFKAFHKDISQRLQSLKDASKTRSQLQQATDAFKAYLKKAQALPQDKAALIDSADSQVSFSLFPPHLTAQQVLRRLGKEVKDATASAISGLPAIPAKEDSPAVNPNRYSSLDDEVAGVFVHRIDSDASGIPSGSTEESAAMDRQAVTLPKETVLGAKSHFAEWHSARSDFCSVSSEVAAIDHRRFLIAHQLEQRYLLESASCASPPVSNLCASFCDGERPLHYGKLINHQRYDWASYLADALFELSERKRDAMGGAKSMKNLSASEANAVFELEREAVRVTNRILVAWQMDVGILFADDDLLVADPLERQAQQVERLKKAREAFIADVQVLKRRRQQQGEFPGVDGYHGKESPAGHKLGSSSALRCTVRCLNNMDEFASKNSNAVASDQELAGLIEQGIRSIKVNTSFFDRLLVKLSGGKLGMAKINRALAKIEAGKQKIDETRAKIEGGIDAVSDRAMFVKSLLQEVGSSPFLSRKNLQQLIMEKASSLNVVNIPGLANYTMMGLNINDLQRMMLFLESSASTYDAQADFAARKDAIEQQAQHKHVFSASASLLQRNDPSFLQAEAAFEESLTEKDREARQLLVGRHSAALLEDWEEVEFSEAEIRAPKLTQRIAADPASFMQFDQIMERGNSRNAPIASFIAEGEVDEFDLTDSMAARNAARAIYGSDTDDFGISYIERRSADSYAPSSSASRMMAMVQTEASEYDSNDSKTGQIVVNDAEAERTRISSFNENLEMSRHVARAIDVAVGGIGSLLNIPDMRIAMERRGLGGNGLFSRSQARLTQQELSMLGGSTQINEQFRESMASGFVAFCADYVKGAAGEAKGVIGRVLRFFKRLSSRIFTGVSRQTSTCRGVLTQWQMESSATCHARLSASRSVEVAASSSKVLDALAVQRAALTSRAITLLDTARIIESTVVMEAAQGSFGASKSATPYHQGLFESLVADAKLANSLGAKKGRSPIQCDGAHLRLASVLSEDELDPRSFVDRVTDNLTDEELEAFVGQNRSELV